MSWAVAALAGALIGCATARDPLVLNPVGPSHATAGPAEAQGWLRVSSVTELHYDGIPYRPHSDYIILTRDGAPLRRVRNATDMTDEEPARVALPAGSYLVKAAARSFGRVIVPVVIEPGRTTAVHLDHRLADSAPVDQGAAAAVRLPNGDFVGWRAAGDDRTRAP